MPSIHYVLKNMNPDKNEDISFNHIQYVLRNNTPIIITDISNISGLEEFIESENEYLPDADDIISYINEVSGNDITAAYFDKFMDTLTGVVQSYYESNQQDFVQSAVDSFFNKYQLSENNKKTLLDEWVSPSEENYDNLFELNSSFNFMATSITLNDTNIYDEQDINNVMQSKINELVANELTMLAEQLDIKLQEKKDLKPKI